MSEELLPYYDKELSYLRRLGAEFGRAHPGIASHLGMGAEVVEDPHVSRLLEGVAFLNARMRHKLDDDFPEIVEAFLGVVYPHYQTPLPSFAVVQFELDRSQAELVGGFSIPRGQYIETEPFTGRGVAGATCRFRTSYDTTLFPFRVADARLRGIPFAAPKTPWTTSAKSVLHVTLESFGNLPIQKFALPRLRFYLNGPFQNTSALYELLLNNALGIALAGAPSDTQPVLLTREQLQPVGFGADEGILDYPPQSFVGYRLLTEFFAYAEKFLFIDLVGLEGKLTRFGKRGDIFIYLDRTLGDLEKNVAQETIALGCTPIVNLFPQRAEPIRLTQTHSEYRVQPDARRPRAYEVYSVDRVMATTADRREVEIQPLYSFRHDVDPQNQHLFWIDSRHAAMAIEGEIDHGTEIDLALVDLKLNPSAPPEWVVDMELTCMNRDLPGRLPYGGGEPRLQLGGAAPVSRILCLTKPTATIRPELGPGKRWRLVSHLALNHLSLSNYEEGAEALREILRLYDFADTPVTRAAWEGLLTVKMQPVISRIAGAVSSGLARGMEIGLHLDETKFSGGGLFLFASVLERFLGLYTSFNSFTRLVLTTNKRDGVVRRWPPRTGQRVLV